MSDLIAFLSARLDEGGLPPRVIEALRAILARYEAMDDEGPLPGLRFAVAQLAAIWSYHPDYRREWAS